MNDYKEVYRKVNEFIRFLYPKKLTGNLARNMNTMTAMITGIINSKETQLPKIALYVPENIKALSTEMRIKRFLINEKATEETFFLPFVQSILQKLDLEEMVLAIDGSLVGRGCVCLMASLIYKNRALPLAFLVIKGKKGHFPEETHIEMIYKLQPLIPESTKRVIVLGDGEFDGINLQETVSSLGWRYVFRTALNINICTDNGPIPMQTLSAFLAEGHYTKINDCRITNKEYGPVTAIGWWEEGCEEPIYLVTNFRSGKMACDYYAMRFTIETFFSDQKSRGFQIHKSHLSAPERLTRLMYASCLAYAWVIFFWYLCIEDRFVQTHSPR
jgi:hypothetical protein